MFSIVKNEHESEYKKLTTYCTILYPCSSNIPTLELIRMGDDIAGSFDENLNSILEPIAMLNLEKLSTDLSLFCSDLYSSSTITAVEVSI